MIVDYEKLKVVKEGIDFSNFLSKWAERYARHYSNPDFLWTIKETDFVEDVFNILDPLIHMPLSDTFKKKVYNSIFITALGAVATQGMLDSEKNARYGGGSISITTMLGDIYVQCLDDPEISSWKDFLDKYKGVKENSRGFESDLQNNSSEEGKIVQFYDFIKREVKNFSHTRQEMLSGNALYQADREGLPAGSLRGQYGSFSPKDGETKGTKGTKAPYSIPLFNRADCIITYFNYLHWARQTKKETEQEKREREWRKKAFYMLAEKSGCDYEKEYLDQIHAYLIEKIHDAQSRFFGSNEKLSQIEIDVLRLFISEAFYLSPYTTLEQYKIQRRNLCGFFSSHYWGCIFNTTLAVDKSDVASKRHTENILGSGKFNGEDVHFEVKLSIKGDLLKLTGGKIKLGKKEEPFEYSIRIEEAEPEKKDSLSDSRMGVIRYIPIEKQVFRLALLIKNSSYRYCIKVSLGGDSNPQNTPPVFLTANASDRNQMNDHIPYYVDEYNYGVEFLTYFFHKFFSYREAKTSWHEVLLALNDIELPQLEFEKIPWTVNRGGGTFGHYGQTDR